MISGYARKIVPSALAFAALVASGTAGEYKQPPDLLAGKKIAYMSVDLADYPLLLPSSLGGERKVRSVWLQGSLNGKGHLSLSGNPGLFSAFGDSSYASDITERAWDVELKPLALQDPDRRKRQIYEIAGAPIKGVSLRLVVPAQPGDSPRLLVVGGKKGDEIQRVLTLENFQK